jgi:hypothetical protein
LLGGLQIKKISVLLFCGCRRAGNLRVLNPPESRKTTTTSIKDNIMKKFIALLLFSSSVFAQDNWRSEDTYREIAFQILHVIDWGQTRYIAEHPENFYEIESAWAIGKHPTTGRVDAYMTETAVLHVIVAYALPETWRAPFQYVTIGMKLNNVVGNASIGIKILF